MEAWRSMSWSDTSGEERVWGCGEESERQGAGVLSWGFPSLCSPWGMSHWLSQLLWMKPSYLQCPPSGLIRTSPWEGLVGRGERLEADTYRWEGLDWKLSWIYQQYLVSVAGEVRGQIEIDERRSKALKPALSITLPPASSALWISPPAVSA